MLIALTLLVALVGLLMWVLSANPKVSEVGKIMFAAGLLAFLISGAPQVVGLLDGKAR